MQAFLTGVRGWIEASHPFPLAAVVLLTGLIGVASSPDDDIDFARLGLVMLAMLLSQLAIGWTNDYVDRETDRLHQPSKPVASHRVDARKMPLAIVAALVGSLAVGGFLGPIPFLLLVVGTVAGLSYDLWLKETRWSWAPYLVAFAVLPLYVWSALDVFKDEFLALYLVATPIVPAIHLANVLPDLDADAASGRRSLAVLLGRRRSLRGLMVLLALPVALALATLPWLDYDEEVLRIVLALFVALTACSFVAYGRTADRAAFRLIALAGVLFTAGWLAAA